jgi:hypothetical protein
MKHTSCLPGLLAAVGVLCAAAPAWSHHSAAVAYNTTTDITVQGVITEVKWENPHSWIFVDVRDASGKVAKWRFEGATPNLLYRRGITPAILKPGINVTIKAHPHRKENAGELTEMVAADGKTLHLGLR